MAFKQLNFSNQALISLESLWCILQDLSTETYFFVNVFLENEIGKFIKRAKAG